MTVNEAITALNSVKPNQYDDETMVGWLSDLDGSLYEDVVCWHEGTEETPHGPYCPEEDMQKELMVPEPHTDLYLKYLCAQIDYYNGEISRYNNAMMMYNAALASFADWFNRTHTPKQENRIEVI